MSPTAALRTALDDVTLFNMCSRRLDVLVDAVAAMAARHDAEITGLLAGGSESVVVSARSRSGTQLVVKGCSKRADAVREAQLLASDIPSPALYDLDEDTGVLTIEHIDGPALNETPIGDPAAELAALDELLGSVTAAHLDPGELDPFPAVFAPRADRYQQTCASTGRPELAGHADRMLRCDDGRDWVPLDLHPKNILIDAAGSWRIIDPMPARHHLNWCRSKWALVRRNPGELAGTHMPMWADATGGEGLEHLVDAAVWEIGSQRSADRSVALLGIVETAEALQRQLQTR